MVAKKKSTEELSVNDQPTLHRKPVTIKKGNAEATVQQSAFDRVWSERDWTVVDDKKSESHKAEPKKETD
jgi:hypothetical protein